MIPCRDIICIPGTGTVTVEADDRSTLGLRKATVDPCSSTRMAFNVLHREGVVGSSTASQFGLSAGLTQSTRRVRLTSFAWCSVNQWDSE